MNMLILRPLFNIQPETNAQMKTTFVSTPRGQLVSAIRPKEHPHELEVGTPLVLHQPYPTQWGELPEGSTGFVSHIEEDSGRVEVFMEGMLPGLPWHWENTLVLLPYSCEDLLECISLSVDNNQTREQQGRCGAKGAGGP